MPLTGMSKLNRFIHELSVRVNRIVDEADIFVEAYESTHPLRLRPLQEKY